MDDIARLLIERECSRLMVAYCTHLDNRDNEAFLDLYTPDGVWARVTEPAFELPGREGIRRFVSARSDADVSRHLVLNPVVEVIDANNATGVSIGLVVRGPAQGGRYPVPMRGVELMVEYRDKYVRTDAGWRIARRDMLRLVDVEAKA